MKMNKAILWAPPKYWKLSEAEKKQYCNGCGPGHVLGFLVPDKLWGLSITAACNIHDFMYAMGENIAEKSLADRVFLNNMTRLVVAGTQNKYLKRLRLRRARTYYYFVHEFGGSFFWDGKNSGDELGEA